MASTTSKVVTYEEWLQMPQTKTKEEVVDGEIITKPPRTWDHATIIDELDTTLTLQLDRKLYRVMSTVFGLVIRKDPLVCREPDLAVFLRKSVVVQDGYIHSAPELVVEVLSPSNTRKDMTARIEDYESIGVPELWILSPEARTFEILQLQEGKLCQTQVLTQGQFRPLRFPDAVVDVTSVWPD